MRGSRFRPPDPFTYRQEVLDHPWNVGSDVPTLKRKILDEFPAHYGTLDFSTLPEDWYDKAKGPYAFAPPVTPTFPKALQLQWGAAATQDRARLVRQRLRKRAEEVIVAVSHRQFITYLLGDPEEVSSTLILLPFSLVGVSQSEQSTKAASAHSSLGRGVFFSRQTA